MFLAAGAVRKWLNLWEVFLYWYVCYVRDKFKVLPGIYMYICYACFFPSWLSYYIIFSPCSIVFFYYYNRTLLHIIQCGGSTLARQEELKLTSSKTRPPKRLDDCTYKNASGSMTYIRDRRRLVPTRSSLMNNPIKFDQLNLSWPLFPLSISLSHSLSFLLYFFFLFFFVYSYFFYFLVRSYFFLYYFCVCMTDFYPIDIAYVGIPVYYTMYIYACGSWFVYIVTS